MANRLVHGVVAGAAGTLALNVTTYLDMLLRGRPASKLPTRVASRLAEEADVSLDFETPSRSDDGGDDGGGGNARVQHRQQALGALLGYANGLGVGLAYGVLRLILPRLPLWLASGLLGGAAMAGSDIPAIRLGLTQPKDWRAVDWAADVVPHLAYGLVTAATFEALND